MNLLEDISDPTDFEDASLRALDMAVRCPVCKEVVNNPAMTPCGHSFCSLCIRSALCATPECPSCREKCTEGLLKRNTMLAEVVQAYNSARPKVLKLAKDVLRSQNDTSVPCTPSPTKRKRDKLDEDFLRTVVKNRRIDSTPTCESPSTLRSVGPPRAYSNDGAGADTMVECPLCRDFVSNFYINQHIDSGCKEVHFATLVSNGRTKGNDDAAKAWGKMFSMNKQRPTKGRGKLDVNAIPEKREPKVAYDTKSSKQLREILSDLGLATEGSLVTLRTRHERWCNMWNAEIDSIKPRTIGCLLEDITDWDRERSRVKQTPKIEDANGYVEAHKDQFTELTESARAAWVRKKAGEP